MKRFLSLLLCLSVICAVFGACTNSPSSAGNSPGNFPQTNSPDGSVDVSGTATGDEKVIHLLTDMGHNAMRTYGTYDQLNAQFVMDQFLADAGGLPEGYKLEVEVMPVEETEFQIRLTRLRTEIMSGMGPDLYVLSSTDAAPYYRQERLFPNTKKAMEDGYFLRLDDYMESARFMEFEDMNPTVMDAGCTPEGRFVLPLRYTFGAARALEPVTDTGASWFDAVNGTDEVLADSYALAASWLFYEIFPETVDTESKTLTFSEEELYDSVAMALKWFGSDPEHFPKDDTIECLYLDGTDGFVEGGNFVEGDSWDPRLKDVATYIPLRNTEGGVSATVTGYIAINRNTAYPEEAFYVADVMMSKKFQSGQRLWEKGYSSYRSSIAVFVWSRGVSVYDDFLQESTPMNYENYINAEMYPVYCELRDKITDVRVMNHVDQALYDLYDYAERNRMTPGDELKKYVKQEYNKMVLMAGEL